MQTSVKNHLHFLAMSQGICWKRKLWSAGGRQALEGLRLGPWASRRRRELLETLDHLQPRIGELDEAVKAEAERRPEVVLLMKQKGVGALTALAFVLTLGPVERFANSRRVVSYLGLNPGENSTGGASAAGAHQQTGQPDDALAAGGSGKHRLAMRCGAAPQISPPEVPAGCQDCQSGFSSSVGGADVLDAAPSQDSSAAGSHAR
jgi:hypothetical protein